MNSACLREFLEVEKPSEFASRIGGRVISVSLSEDDNYFEVLREAKDKCLKRADYESAAEKDKPATQSECQNSTVIKNSNLWATFTPEEAFAFLRTFLFRSAW